MEELVDAAHDKGMKVFFDIITNHTADVVDYEEGEYSYIDKATSPYTDAAGNAFDDKEYAAGDTFPELDPATSFPYTPVFRSEADETVKVPAWLNDPTLYHNRGDSTFAGESSEYGDFIGLDDLFTEQPEVREGMGDIYSYWASEFGIDGFRIDTVKHVNMEFWQDFSPTVLDAAKEAGKDDFFMFGEVFDANPELMSRYTTEGDLQATLDFGFQAAARGFAEGKPTTGVRDLFAGDDYYTDADSNAYQLPTFLGNHDMGRIGSMLDDTASGDDLLARTRLANQLMYLVRGQPVVYYGDEQGFIGDGGDKDARQDMFASQVTSYNDDAMIGGVPTGSRDRFGTDGPLYQSISELGALRDKYPALADGAQVHRYASDSAGIYAFSRVSRDRKPVEYLVVANNSTEPKTADLATWSRDDRWKPLYGGGSRLRTDAEGRVTVTVPPLSVQVWRATDTRRRHEEGARGAPHLAVGRLGGGRPRRDRGGRAREHLRAGLLRLPPGGDDGLDEPRHRRQRAVPRLPRRQRRGRRDAAGVPRRARGRAGAGCPRAAATAWSASRSAVATAVAVAASSRSSSPRASPWPATTTPRWAARATGSRTAPRRSSRSTTTTRSGRASSTCPQGRSPTRRR